MSQPALISLIGLGFGDCGKGLFTDFFCRQTPLRGAAAAPTCIVVRFNGGAQAGHNVVLPDGRHHTFSQFGAGTLVPGVVTVLAQPVIVHPTALQVEELALQAIGITNAFARLHIDARCRINTPFHQAAGRLRELQRASAGHGSCGVGVGEVARHALSWPDEVLRYADLLTPALALQRLQAQRQRFQLEFSGLPVPVIGAQVWQRECALLADEHVPMRWLAAVQPLVRQCPPAETTQLAALLQRARQVVFEGAQGMLLDEDHGFHPHTTWSRVGPNAAEEVARGYGLTEPHHHLGIVRSYLTRHGHGPFPTHHGPDDPRHHAALHALPEPHNIPGGWQGAFRRGHPDAVLLRYSLAAAGPLQALLVSHLDAFATAKLVPLVWCDRYDAPEQTDDSDLCVRNSARQVTALRPRKGDLAHQARLTNLLWQARPVYAATPVESARECVARLEAYTGCAVWYGSFGPTFETVQRLKAP